MGNLKSDVILSGLMLSKFSLSKFYLITSVNFSSNWCILFRKMFLNITHIIVSV